MCGLLFGPLNVERVRDEWRGRLRDVTRFRRLASYAYRRWEKTRDLRYAHHWWLVLQAIKRREYFAR